MSNYITVIVLLIFGISYSQKQELGNVTLAELTQKNHPSDSSAVAAVLFNKGLVYFEYVSGQGFRVITDVEYKIKIYKKEGYDYANQQIRYFSEDSDKETVTISQGCTYNLVNGFIEKTVLKAENVFTEHEDDIWSLHKIIMPNVKEGSVVEFRYIKKSPFYGTLQDWKFQKSIPVNYSEFSTEIPEFFIYTMFLRGKIVPVETTVNSNESFKYSASGFIPANGANQHKLSTVNYVVKKNTYKLRNLPAIKEELCVNNVDNYTAGMEHELSGVQFPSSGYKSFSTTWTDVAQKIYDNDRFGKQIGKNNYFEKDINNLIKGIDSKEEKMKLVFNYLKSRMNWNSLNGYLTNAGVQKAYEDKIGNAAEINLMLIAMLRYSGIKSYPVLISTRSNGVSIFPTRTGVNYVIATAEINGATILLDATSKFSMPSVLPLRVLNWNGILIEKSGTSKAINVMPEITSNKSVNLVVALDSNGKITGKVREQYNDYYAMQFRTDFNEISNDAIAENIERKVTGIEVLTYELSNKENQNEPIIEKYDIINTAAAETIGNKMYFTPLLHFANKTNPFKQEIREYPIDFSFPFNQKYRINITIPEQFSVESLPKSSVFKMKNNYGSFVYTISNTNNQIQLLMEYNINASIIPSEDYEAIKEFYKLLIEKQNEKIILKKI